MAPIESLSNIVRMPRLGKIRLGIKVDEPGKHPYPKATDYFVVPPEVAEVFGKKPTELEIMFPTEDAEQFAQQWLRAYSMTQGLVCIGDGQTSRRKVDKATGAMAGRDTKDWVWKDGLSCDPQECPEYLSKRCRRVMNLQVLIPAVTGLGVWQIDTSSFYSIVNINSMIKMLKAILGRCSMIPLTLGLGPIEVTPPGMSKKMVRVMHIKKDIKLADLARLAQLPPAQVLLPEPEVEEAPEDLFPPEVIGEPPGDDLFPSEPVELPADQRLMGWNAVRGLLKETKPMPALVKKWFRDHYDLDVKMEDFDQGEPVEKFTNPMLSRFCDSLLAFRQARTATGPIRASLDVQ